MAHIDKRIQFRGNGCILQGIEYAPEGTEIPPELLEIQEDWKAKADAYGDVGSCVMGAGFEFTYQGQDYKMPPTTCWQGSCSWEAFVPEIRKRLEEIGATEIRFDYGNMD